MSMLLMGCGSATDFTPASLGFDVAAATTAGVFSDAGGTTPQTTEGGTVQSWTNAGTLGGLLAKLSDVNGPVLRLNSGNPYLEFGPAAGGKYALGMDVASAGTGDLTIAMVMRHDEDTTTSQFHQTAWTTTGTASGSSGGCAAYLSDQTYGQAVGYDSADGYGTTTCFRPLSDGKWHVVIWRRTAGSPSRWQAWVDGQEVLNGTTATTATMDRFNVGGPMYTAGLRGGVAVAAMKRGLISDPQVTALSNYYLTSHPLLATNAKVMVVCGDSTSTPANAFETWATIGTWLKPRGLVWQYGSYLQTNNGLGRFWNNSHGGKATATHRTEAARIAAWLNRGTSKRVLVIDSGTNDIRAGGAGLTPAQSYAQILGLQSDIAALVPGLATAIATIGDGNPAVYAGFTALRNTLNGLIVDGAAANGYTAIRRDLELVGSDWGTPGRDDTWFYGDTTDANRDGLHRIAPGMDLEAAVFQTALAAIL